MDEVGFEPTSANTVDLKSTPLDQTRALILTLSLYFVHPRRGSNPRPHAISGIYTIKGVRSTY